jgi:acetyltransferase
MDKHYLTPLFAPKSVVVFAGNHEDPSGQTEYGRFLASNLKPDSGFKGEVRFIDVNMSGTLSELADARCDLAIIALPEPEIAKALEIAGRIHSRAAVILSGGIDAVKSADLHATARRHGLQLLGPNGLGLQRPQLHLNASVLGTLAAPGSLALISQSGALTTSTLDWAARNGVGFSAVVSLGQNPSVNLADILDFLSSDAATHSIVIYLEGIQDARRFMSALRVAAYAKPVVVLKAGRRPAGSRAALTHSGAIVGTDDVFDAALRRAGAVRVRSFVQLFSAAKCLASRYRPVGKRLAVITNGGGPGVLAADWINEIGLDLAHLSAESIARLTPQLGIGASTESIIDLAEDATPEHYKLAVEIAAKDTQADGVLVVHSPKIGCDSTAIAARVAELLKGMHKPLLTCWMGDAAVTAGRNIFNEASIPSFRTPEAAVDAFSNIASFYQNQRLLQQTPPPLSDLSEPDIEGARILIESVLAERRKVLTEMESKALLAAFHIPVTKTMLARSPNEAMMIANQFGYPVALKIDSPDVLHKSDVQGVVLNLLNAAQVRDAYAHMLASVKLAAPQARINGVTVQNMSGKPHGREVYVGLVTDQPFGPVITFGAGGTMIELIADRAMELPPLNQFLARSLIDRTRVSETLGAWRGLPPASLESIEQILLRVSEMVCELPQLREMDINPIVVDENGALAVDARIVIDHASNSAQRYQHLAIAPYPSHVEQEWPLGSHSSGGEASYVVRPIRPDDAEMLQTFVRGMSPQSRYFRFASSMMELPARMLARYTLIDYDREMALVAIDDGGPGEEKRDRIIGVSRFVTNPDSTSCEFSLAVSDEFSGRGVGSRLMRCIADFARARGLTEIDGLVLANNENMLSLMRGLGYTVKPFVEDPDFKLVSKSL